MKKPGRLRTGEELLNLFRSDAKATIRVVAYKQALARPLRIVDGAGNCRGLFYEEQLEALFRGKAGEGNDGSGSAAGTPSALHNTLVEIRDLLKAILARQK